MTTTQSWAGLPDHIKRQAAPDILAGKIWYYGGVRIEPPGVDELRRWACSIFAHPENPAPVAGNITPPPGKPEARQRAHSARETPHKPATRQEKRDAVDLAILKNADTSDRELARRLGVSHTFIAMRRRKAGNGYT